MDTLFLLSSACLLPITEVCREGPHDWFTGCKEDKQVCGLANICQGWISLKPEPKGKKEGAEKKNQGVIMETNTLEILCAAAAVVESPLRCASALSSVSLKSSAAP